LFGGKHWTGWPELRRRKPEIWLRTPRAQQPHRPPLLGVDYASTRRSPRWGSTMLSYRFPGAYAAWLLTVVPLGLGGRKRWKSRSETRNALSPKARPAKHVPQSMCHQSMCHQACPPKCPPKRSFYKLFFVLLRSLNAGQRCVWSIHTVSAHTATDSEHSVPSESRSAPSPAIVWERSVGGLD